MGEISTNFSKKLKFRVCFPHHVHEFTGELKGRKSLSCIFDEKKSFSENDNTDKISGSNRIKWSI
jgi:hypothetical protein